jgi:hypothetical protein
MTGPARADARPDDLEARSDLALAQTPLCASDERKGDHTATKQFCR